MARPVESERDWLVSWTYQWLDAVDRQAERVRSAPDKGAGQVEILLFVAALRNVIRGAERLLGHGHPAVEAFRAAVPHAVEVRKMLEHFDAYLAGKGNLQDSNSPRPWLVYFSSVDAGGERTVHVDRFSLDVSAAAVAAGQLAHAAQQAPSITPVSQGPLAGESQRKISL